jgi:type IV pilus assembly protein PilE
MKHTGQRRQQGLTLIELMVVVAVMAVIAAIAYPLYTNQVQKARRADAKVALETLAMAQERYYTINGEYAGTLSSLQVSAEIAGGDSADDYYAITLTQDTKQEYTANAEAKSDGPQSGDRGDCRILTIDHQGTKSHTGSATRCW